MNLDKLTIFKEGLKDPTVEVCLVPGPGLIVPGFLKFPTMFVYGLNLTIQIPDLKYDDHGIYATLSFDQTPYETYVPWAVVFGIILPSRGIGISWEMTIEDSNYSPPTHIGKKPHSRVYNPCLSGSQPQRNR
jgi:hypothetical protein